MEAEGDGDGEGEGEGDGPEQNRATPSVSRRRRRDFGGASPSSLSTRSNCGVLCIYVLLLCNYICYFIIT